MPAPWAWVPSDRDEGLAWVRRASARLRPELQVPEPWVPGRPELLGQVPQQPEPESARVQRACEDREPGQAYASARPGQDVPQWPASRQPELTMQVRTALLPARQALGPCRTSWRPARAELRRAPL